jgi:tetratricopeptide (TPR) repeat protein
MPDGPKDDAVEPFAPDLEDFDSLRSPGRLVAWAGVVLVVVLVLAWAVFPAYRAAKAVRARAAAKQGETLLLAGRLDEAAAKLRTALAFGPNEPDVLRFAAQSLSIVRSPQALSYWEMLVATPKATHEDRLDLVRAALAAGRFERARTMLEQLYETAPSEPNLLGLGIEYFRATGNRKKAVEASRQLLVIESAADGAKLVAGEVLLQSAETNDATRALKLLAKLGDTSGAIGNAALAALASYPALPADEGVKVLAKLTNRPAANPRSALVAADLWVRLNPAETNQASAWLAQTMGHEPPPGDEVLEVGAWWLRQGKADQLLSWIPASRGRTNANWLLIRAEALSTEKRWSEIDRMIGDTNNVLNPFQRSIFQALNLWAQGNIKESHRTLSALVDSAHDHPERLLALAAAAENVDAAAAAVECWRELTRFPSMQLTAGVHAIKAARRLGDARTLIDVYRDFAKSVPADYGVRVEIAYYRLLLGDPVEDIRGEFQALPSQLRQSDRGQVLQAMIAMREGSYSDALVRMESPHFDWAKTEPRWALLYAAVLAANRQREAARTLERLLDPADFMPVERQFANAWLPERL